MPLSDNPDDFHSWIKELVKSGRPQKQAVAISYSHLRDLHRQGKKRTKKGKAPQY